MGAALVGGVAVVITPPGAPTRWWVRSRMAPRLLPMSELNLSLVFLFALSVITLLITPGPVTLLVARAGLVGGMRHAFATICGTNLASLVLIVLLLVVGILLKLLL